MPTAGTAATGRIGRYLVQDELKRGVAASVYRALDPAVGRPVAIKILSSEAGEGLVARFRREAAAAAGLQHQNIVTIYELGDHQGRPFIAMEFLAGEDLSRAAAGGVQLPLLDKVNIMAQVADGLAFAHRNGVLHRDLRPANIRVLPDGTARILDFGISRVVEDTATGLMKHGEMLDSLLYTSPERLVGAEPDVLTDIFAYGVTYYFLLTGRNPFQSGDHVSLPSAGYEAEPLRALAPECPESLDQIVHRAMMGERSLRYQTVEDLQYDAGLVLLELRQARAAELLPQARELVAAERLEEALPVLVEALNLDPANRDARRLRDQIQTQLRRQALKPRIDELTEKSDGAAATRHWDEAIGYLQSAIRLDRDNEEVLARIQEVRGRADRCARAAKMLAEAREEIGRGAYESALALLTAAAALDSEGPEIREILSGVRDEVDRRQRQVRVEGKLQEARSFLAASHFDAALRAIDSLSLAGRSSPEAEDLYRAIAAQRREYERRERLRSELGAVGNLLQDSAFAEAAERLKRLQEEFPGEETVSGLIAFATEERQRAEAASVFERWCREAMALANAGSFEPALARIEEELRRQPASPAVIRIRDQVLEARSQSERRQAVLEAKQRAEELGAQRRYEEAAAELDRALAAWPCEAELEQVRASLRGDQERDRRAQRVTQALEGARRQLENNCPAGAVRVLETALSEFRNPQLEDELARASAVLLAKEHLDATGRIQSEARAQAASGWFGRALDIVDAGLAQFPGQPDLECLRSDLAAEQARQERDQAVGNAIRRAGRMRDEKRFSEALRVIAQASSRHPGPEWDGLREQIQAESEAHARNGAVARALADAEALIEDGQPGAAVELLNAALERHASEPQLPAALSRAKEAVAARTREEKLAQVRREVRACLVAKWFDSAAEKIEAAAADFPGEAGVVDELRHEMTALRDESEAEKRVVAAAGEARVLLSEHRPAEADQIVAQALTASPHDPRLLRLRREIGEAQSAERQAHEVRKATEEANARLAAGEPERAVAILTEVCRRAPADAEAGQALARAGEALRQSERARGIQTAAAEARAWASDGRFGLAFEACDSAIAQWGDDPELLRLRQALVSEKAEWESREERARAIRQSEALAGRMAFADALHCVDAALDRYPKDAGLKEARERISAALNQHRRAEASAAIAEAEALLGAGDNGAAMQILRKAQQSWPDFPEISEALGRARAAESAVVRRQKLRAAVETCESLVAEGRLDDATRALEEALASFPAEPELLAIRDRLRVAWESAERREGVERALRDATAALERGDPFQAVALLEAARARYPWESQLSQALEDARVQAGRRRQRDLDEVFRKTQVFVADGNFDQALETVQQSLTSFAQDSRLLELREAVLAARAQKLQETCVNRPPAMDETQVLPVMAAPPRAPAAQAAPRAKPRKRLAAVVIAGTIIAGGGWFGANRLLNLRNSDREAVIEALRHYPQLRAVADPQITGSIAEVRCARTSADGPTRPQLVRVRLVKTAEGLWRIDSVGR